jgi:NSS family neurotransmitter:Na+ symporter
MGVGAAFMILIFYNTVAGWTLEYIYQSVTNSFEGKSSDELTSMFDGFREGSIRPLLWMVVFMAITAWIVLAGVQKGIEKYTKILMPILLVLIIILDIRALTLPGGSEGLSFLFKPDFSKINGKTVLEALGQAFFSLSIGMGTLITYGSYIRRKENLANTALSVSLADTFVAILAGIAIFPAVFAFGINPASGEKLVFIVLPEIFQQMPGGYIFSFMFFVLLAVAALTSTISILEVVVAYFVEELKMVRKKATILATVSISAAGIFAAASWGWASDLTLFGLNVFQFTDFATVNILLPVGGFFIVIFIGWFLKARITGDELSNSGSFKVRYLPAFMFIVKFIAPIAIALVFLYNLGIFGN